MNPTINVSPAKGSVDGRLISQINAYTYRIDLNPHAAPASLLGGHSTCDPPDPISNSAVKPGSADGTSA